MDPKGMEEQSFGLPKGKGHGSTASKGGKKSSKRHGMAAGENPFTSKTVKVAGDNAGVKHTR
jgi:hypothetical protein